MCTVPESQVIRCDQIWQDSRLAGAVVVFRDISQRREIKRQREAAYLEIKHLKEQLELERDYLRDEIKVASDFEDIIGVSQALKRTLAQIEAVAATPASVLVLGESGVGKEMVARCRLANLGQRRSSRPTGAETVYADLPDEGVRNPQGCMNDSAPARTASGLSVVYYFPMR